MAPAFTSTLSRFVVGRRTRRSATTIHATLPQTAQDMVHQAANAVSTALVSGSKRLSIDLLLPINQRAANFTFTEQLDYPESEASVYKTAVTVCESLIHYLPGRANVKVLSKLIDDERESPCGLVYPESRDICFVVLPNADRMSAIKKIAELEPTRPLIIFNSQWVEAGQVISDFGVGPWRRATEDFLATFSAVYILKESRIGAASTLDADGSAMGMGGVARVLFDGKKWMVYAMGGDGSSVLAAEAAARPSYDDLMKIFSNTELSLKTKRKGTVSQEQLLEATIADASPSSWALRSSAEVAAAVRARTISPADVDVLEKSALRAALAVFDAPGAGKLVDLRSRLKAELAKANK